MNEMTAKNPYKSQNISLTFIYWLIDVNTLSLGHVSSGYSFAEAKQFCDSYVNSLQIIA
jgi:hypothetical protein